MGKLLRKGRRLPLWLTFGMPVRIGSEDKSTLILTILFYLFLTTYTAALLYYRH